MLFVIIGISVGVLIIIVCVIAVVVLTKLIHLHSVKVRRKYQGYAPLPGVVEPSIGEGGMML